jgi:hypothetical protein
LTAACLAATLPPAVSAAPAVSVAADAVPSAIPLRARPVPLDAVRLLDGPFKRAQDLDAAYLLRIEPDRLLARFRAEAGLPEKAKPYGGWEGMDICGHSLGHYLSACALIHAATGDARFRARADAVVDELAAVQAAFGDGYVGAVPAGRTLFADVAAGKIETANFKLNGCWVPWYNLHKTLAGLLDARRWCGSAKAEAVFLGLAGWTERLLARLTDDQVQAMLACEHGGMSESLAEAWAITGEARFRAAAERFGHRAVLDPLARGEDCLPRLHANTQIPKLAGAARLAELTGDARLRAAAGFFWTIVTRDHSYAIGGHGDHEYFGPPRRLADRLTANTAEVCGSYNMLRLTHRLFTWSADAACADFAERALLNHILASQHPSTGMMCYFVPLKPGRAKEYSSPFDTFTCCVGTGMENHARHGECVYYQDDAGLFVNLFVASELAWREKGVTIRQETRFPDEGATRLVVAGDRPVRFALRVRHPAWAEGPLVLRLNGEALASESRPSGYATVDREWKPGDALEVRFPMRLRLEATPDNPRRVAVLCGPVVLAGVIEKPLADADAPVFVTEGRPVDDWARPVVGETLAFTTAGVGRPADVPLRPLFRVHDRPYAVYWDLFTEAEWTGAQEAYRAEQRRRRDLEARTVDVMRLGEMQPERDHAFQGERSVPNHYNDQPCRDARQGGWFSFAVKVLPDRPVALAATYWGSDESNRVFDILVEGTRVATQTLERNRPGAFFVETYPIPPELTRGKEKVTVRFQAHPGKTAGRVFECRIVRPAEAVGAGETRETK